MLYSDNHLIAHLLKDMQQGDEQAFHNLYTGLRPAIYGYSLAILKNREDALDNTQDVFVTIYQKITTYEAREKPLNWIFTITKNAAISKIRKKEPLIDWDCEIIPSNDNPNQQILIKNIMSILAEDERQIIILHLLWGFKYREIGTILQLNTSTVLSKYHRALKKIKAWEVMECAKN